MALPTITDRFNRLNPPPTRDIPILIGGGGEKKTLRMVAEYATTWHAFGDVETLRHKSGVLEEWCRKVGRDFAAIERSTATNPARITEAAGTTDADAKYDLGFRQFTLSVSGPDYDLAVVPRWLEWRDAKNAGS